MSDLILVSNRGPITFDVDDDGNRVIRRGGGGLVSVLTGLVKHRDALWIASAMTDADADAADEHDGRSFDVELNDIDYRVRLVTSSSEAFEDFYSVIANPMLWFIQHYLWDLSNAPDIRAHEIRAWDYGYKQVNINLATAIIEEISHSKAPTVMMHDYHLYTCPNLVREQRPDAFLHHFVHIPWPQPDAWRILPERIRNELFSGILGNDIIGFHTESYCRNFLHCCRELLGLDTDFNLKAVLHDGRETWVRAYPIAVDAQGFAEAAKKPSVIAKEEEILKRRREHLIVRIDRADLSKNILRGFTAFDIFLEQHAEFHEKVTFIAHLQPSRQDVPEYVEYLEKINALVAVINHRHGTTDWMPINLRLHEDIDEAVATYKHFDVLLVNSIFDGMNLVSKEGPLVNEADGVMILSDNTGSHEELGDYALSVNPFDVQQQADAIYRALTMPARERADRSAALKRLLTSRTPSDWLNAQFQDIELFKQQQPKASSLTSTDD